MMEKTLKNNKYILTLLLLSLILNTSTGQTTGNLKIKRSYYDNKNTILMEVYTINSIGQRHGVYNFYNAFSVTTSPEIIAYYKNNMLDGQRTIYFTFTHTSLSGIVKETCDYKENKKNGKEILYDYVYNGNYLWDGMDEDKKVEYIQKGKRVIREELIYAKDILLSRKGYHPNGKIEGNQKFDSDGNIIYEIVSNEYGEVTGEVKYDENGSLIKKFSSYSNGKIKEKIEKDSTGYYKKKEYYETGDLKKEQVLDNLNKTLSETTYWENGKLKSKTNGLVEEIYSEAGLLSEIITKYSNGDLKNEEFFENASTKKKTKINNERNIIEQVVYKSPGKLNYEYFVKNDSSFFNEYDENNQVRLSEIEDKNNNGINKSKINNGGYLETSYKRLSNFKRNYPTEENDKKILLIKEYDVNGKLISEESFKYDNGTNSNWGSIDIIKKVYSISGGYFETTTNTSNNIYNQTKTLKSTREVDSSGAYQLLKYNFNKTIIAKSLFNANGIMILDSTTDYIINYDSLGNKIFEIEKNRDQWNQNWYDEYKYESDGYIRNRQYYKTNTYYNSTGSSETQDKYPQERIFKFSKTLNKKILLGTLLFDEKGNKRFLLIFDQSGNQIKEIKLKNNDEKQYFSYFQIVN